MTVTQARPVTPQGIIAQRLAALVSRADGIADTGFVAELSEVSALASGMEDYIAGNTTSESPALSALADRTRGHAWSGSLEQEMLSGHVEGRLLALLVELAGARRVLDIGMFTGYSALAMAEALPEGGTVVALEVDADAVALAREAFAASGAGARIDIRVGDAAESLAALADAGDRFEVVFVDADKAGYLGYVETVLDRDLLAPGGLICVDNTLMQGQPWAGERTANGEAIAAFNAAVTENPRVTQVVLGVRDGITLIRRA